jgi:hypothetical protein
MLVLTGRASPTHRWAISCAYDRDMGSDTGER